MNENSEEIGLQDEIDELELQDEKDKRLEKKKLRNQLTKRWQGLSEHAAQVAITRKFPAWCEGYQGTLPIELCENLDDVQKRCGGGTYILRFVDGSGEYVMQQTVIIGGDPMEAGVRLETPEEKKKRIRQEEEVERLRQIQATQVQAQANQGSEFVKAMTIMQATQEQALQQVMRLAQGQAAQPLPQPGNIKEHFTLFKELQENYSGNTEGNEGMWNVIEKFVDKMGDEQKKEQAAPRLIGSTYQNLQPAPVVQGPIVTAQPVEQGTAQGNPNDPVLSAFNELSELDGVEAWARMNQVFEHLPEEKQKKLEKIFGPGDNVEDQEPEIDAAENDSDGVEDDEQPGAQG